MGTAIGASLRSGGNEVLWASEGRSVATSERARAAGFLDVGTLAEIKTGSDAIVSICPPHAALDLAHAVSGFGGLYVDANAISPTHAAAVGAVINEGGGRYVDAAIIVASARPGDRTRLFLSGEDAPQAASLFAAGEIDVRIISPDPTLASALKMSQAAWNKGTQALIVSIRAFARAMGVDADLVIEYQASNSQLIDNSHRSAAMAATRGWRWSGEMEEVAASFRAVGLPGGFHDAAADIFARAPRVESAAPDEATLRLVTDALNRSRPVEP
jgi:3-hydroxyisobutyrate dehydrogenase-like beta-hydroxyacid dehydrogenase